MEKYKIGKYFGEQLKVILESENGNPMEWDSFKEAYSFIHEGNVLPSHEEDGTPIGWVILPPLKKEGQEGEKL